MATTRLYHDDPLLLAFDAEVVAHAAYAGAPSVVLDRTAFYPEAGGQMADRGVLGDRTILDVQVDDDGIVHHMIGGDLLAIGERVSGNIERTRRRAHMALHSAQHALSRALVDLAAAETVSARLGESECTIDVDVQKLEERDLARAEDLVNAVIDDDLAIRAYFPTPDELRVLPLRRAPKVTENIRVVDIGGFDVSPCGGTHCTRSSQIGLVRVYGLERYKGKMRVKFTAGPRARGELGRHDDMLRAVARDLTCGPSDVPGAFEKLRRELDVARDQAKRLSVELAESVAIELWNAATTRGDVRVVTCFDDMPLEFLRAVGARLTAEPEAVALLASRGEGGTNVLVARGTASAFDCGAFLKRVAAAAGGRGGGRPHSAEGRLPREIDWAALCATD